MNKIILLGRAVKEAETQTMSNGDVCAKFTLAVERPYKSADGKPNVDFISIVAWKNIGSVAGKYVKKGTLILLEGSLQINKYTSQDGSIKFLPQVTAQSIKLLSKQDTQSQQNNEEYNQTQPELNELDPEDELPF